MTRAPAARNACTLNSPTVPQPITATLSPTLTPDRRTACTATVAGSIKGASRSEMLSGNLIRWFAGHVMYSANPPSADSPATHMLLHVACDPLMHQKHVPHVLTLLTTTRSPTDNPAAPSPNDSMCPDISCPRISGISWPLIGLGPPCCVHRGPYCHSSMSVAQIEVLVIRSFASPMPGIGSGRSSIRMSLLPWILSAFIVRQLSHIGLPTASLVSFGLRVSIPNSVLLPSTASHSHGDCRRVQ